MSDDLLFAVKSSDLEEVKSLIKDGTDINSTGQFGWTALHLAIYDGKREIIDWLLGQKLNTNIKSDDGCTALHYAANAWDEQTIKRLMAEHGADIRATDNRGQTPFESGVSMGCPNEILARLKE